MAFAGAVVATWAIARNGTPLHADLFGRNVIDTDGRKRSGDLNGRGSFTGIIEGGQLCFGLTLAKVDRAHPPWYARTQRTGRAHARRA